jgi:hypothetical protein
VKRLCQRAPQRKPPASQKKPPTVTARAGTS